MKRTLSTREKVLIVILAVLAAACVYYYAFVMPVSNKTDEYESEILTTEELIVTADAKAAKMKQMEAELAAILADGSNVRELPAYDNSRNVMEELSHILQNAESYDVSFETVEIEESTVRRNITLDFECRKYETVKSMLASIHDSQYRCLLKDLTIEHDSNERLNIFSELTGDDADTYNVSVMITYYEYV